ncbi:MAG: peptidoglycan-binding protein, partial [Terriglobia bacterium]
MALEKLTITPDPASNLPVIQARFNPERYTVNKSVQIAEIAIPGLDSPVQQFVRGQTEKITMELFFDTTQYGMVEGVKDVREETKEIYQLLKVNSELHAPPRCLLLWGEAGKLFSFGTSISPWCLLESVSEEFTLFSPSGVPLRAKLNVTLREAWTIEDQLLETPRHSSDRNKIRTLQRGQTLSHLAWAEYDDAGAWRLIADANGIENPRRVAPGTRLLIPRVKSE